MDYDIPWVFTSKLYVPVNGPIILVISSTVCIQPYNSQICISQSFTYLAYEHFKIKKLLFATMVLPILTLWYLGTITVEFWLGSTILVHLRPYLHWILDGNKNIIPQQSKSMYYRAYRVLHHPGYGKLILEIWCHNDLCNWRYCKPSPISHSALAGKLLQLY